jgi:NCAIR mutase (PurE)-related protein
MKTVGKSANILESRLSQHIERNDDVVAIEEEIQEQIEEDNVEKAARENATGVPVPIVRSNKEMETADDAVASREELKSKPRKVA